MDFKRDGMKSFLVLLKLIVFIKKRGKKEIHREGKKNIGQTDMELRGVSEDEKR